MLLFLCALPMWLGAFFTVLVPTAVAMLGPIALRKRYPLSVLAKNNEIAGFHFATVGAIYGVILAFAIVAVWDKFNEAEALVLREAGAAATLYRFSSGDEPGARATHAALDTYLRAVVEDDWPHMAVEREGRDAGDALEAVYLAASRLANESSLAAGVEIMKEVGAMTEARRGRLHYAMGVVPPALWLMLVFGAVLTIGFSYFFGLENLKSQVAMTAGLAMIIFLGLFVIVSYDHPFTGEVFVEPHPIKAVYNDFHQANHINEAQRR